MRQLVDQLRLAASGSPARYSAFLVFDEYSGQSQATNRETAVSDWYYANAVRCFCIWENPSTSKTTKEHCASMSNLWKRNVRDMEHSNP